MQDGSPGSLTQLPVSILRCYDVLVKMRHAHWCITITRLQTTWISQTCCYWVFLLQVTLVSLVPSGLWQFLRFPLLFMTLRVLRRNSRYPVDCPQILFGAFLMTFLGLQLLSGLLNRSLSGITCHPHDIVGDVNLCHWLRQFLPAFSIVGLQFYPFHILCS